MARIHARAASIYVDEFDYSGVSNALVINIGNDPADVTAFADTHATYVEGKPGFTVAHNGLYDPQAGGFDAEMFTDLTAAQRRLGIFPGGTTQGNYGYEGQTNISASPRTAEIGAATGLNVNWQGDTPLVRATVLDVDTAVAATGNSTTKVQRGAIGATETGVGVLRLLSIGGAGSNTLDVAIQSDADNSAGGETTRISFTQLSESSGATSEVVTVAGAITDQWWWVDYTYAGAGSRTFSLVISFGIRPT